MELPKGFSSIAQLESSNSALYEEFSLLVWFYIRRWQARLKFTNPQADELFADTWAKLFSAPLAYRNKAGMNFLAIRRVKRSIDQLFRNCREQSSGLVEDYAEEMGIEEQTDQKIREALRILTDREIVVLGLLHHFASTDCRTIAGILNRDIWWVRRRLESIKSKVPQVTSLYSI